MRVATYTRISTDEEHQPYSLEAQRERLGAYIQSQDGWELTRSFTDQMSGSTLERPELQRALDEARLHRYDLLLVYRVDRLSRSVRGLAQILEELDQTGVHFRSATEPFDTGTPAGRMMVQMLAVFAEFERATLIDRVIAGMERKAAQGGWLGGTIPYGYRHNTDTGYLAPDETEAPLVPVIFDLYSNKRLGCRSVAMWLNQRGHRSRAGRPWSHMTVLTVLRNRAYLGEVYFRGSHHPAPHLPLVATEVFQATQKLLEVRGEDHAKRRSNPTDYLLSGLLTCGNCGKRFIGNAAHGKRGRYRYYTCFSRRRYGIHSCQTDPLPAEQLDQAVIESLLRTYENSDLIADAVREAQARTTAALPHYQEQLAAAETEIKKTEEAVERYFLAFEAGTMPQRQCGQRIEALGQKLADLQCRRKELQEQMTVDEPHQFDPLEVAATLADIRQALEEGTPQQQKALLQALVAEVKVDSREAIYPTFRVPQGGVRLLSRVVDPGGVEPPTF